MYDIKHTLTSSLFRVKSCWILDIKPEVTVATTCSMNTLLNTITKDIKIRNNGEICLTHTLSSLSVKTQSLSCLLQPRIACKMASSTGRLDPCTPLQ